tara:strand:+ start:246 stop:761 length:516 start_codon:yes stop_codon:yes gene_type:complete
MRINKTYKNYSHSRGFTLVEMIVAIIFIGIFATLALTRTQLGISTFQVQIAIDQITNDIDLARSMAFAKHDTITIVFSKTGENYDESYTIYSGPDNDRNVIIDFPNSTNGVISLDNSKMRNIDITEVNLDQGTELQFIPLGDCSLASNGSIVLNSKTIQIEPITGKWTINN